MRLLIKLIPFILVLLSSGCAEQEDCIGCNLNPKVKIKFEPYFIKLQTDSLFTNVKAEIKVLVDSLDNELTPEQVELIESELKKLREDSARLDIDYNLFRQSKALIDEITAPGATGMELFQDTVIQNFALPVNMNSDTTTFYFSYHGFEDTLQLYYQRRFFQNLDGVRMQLTDIGVNKELSTFDSLRVKCNNGECSNDRTTVFIYF